MARIGIDVRGVHVDAQRSPLRAVRRLRRVLVREQALREVAAVAPLSAMKSRTIASSAAVVTPGWMCGSTWARDRAASAPVSRIPSKSSGDE